MGSSPVYDSDADFPATESGYVSGEGSEASLPEIYFTKSHLTFLNRQLQLLEPQGASVPLLPVSAAC